MKTAVTAAVVGVLVALGAHGAQTLIDRAQATNAVAAAQQIGTAVVEQGLMDGAEPTQLTCTDATCTAFRELPGFTLARGYSVSLAQGAGGAVVTVSDLDGHTAQFRESEGTTTTVEGVDPTVVPVADAG